MGAPKLLDKKLVSAEVATQKKQQIDSGIALARKVDAVRQTLQEEQKSLEEFRIHTVAIAQAEVDSIIRQKDTLKDEVRVLEKRKELALIPLTVEWETVGKAKREVVKDRQKVEEMSFNLTEREGQIEREEAEIENEKQRTKDLNRRAAESLAEADLTLIHAREAAAEIRNKAQVVLTAVEAREREVALKETDLESREVAIEKEKLRQLGVEQDLANREKKLRVNMQVFAKSQAYIISKRK